MADGISAKIPDLDAKLMSLARLGEAGVAAVLASNQVSAREFMSSVAQIVPIGDDDKREGEHLVTTLATGEGKTPTAVQVSIGGPEAPYVLHLEAGHNTKDGKHVPGRPFWWVTMRLNQRKYRARVARAVNTAVKRAFGGHS